jgi:PIN domain nuclease of toxin-antitoxin system
VRLLLDTHALLWWMTDDPSLPAPARRAIGSSDNDVVVSAASVWEMSIKAHAGRLRLPSDDVAGDLHASHLRLLPISPAHAWLAGALPQHHRDPFDRMLIAQAQVEGLTIVTRDRRFEPYGVPLLAA